MQFHLLRMAPHRVPRGSSFKRIPKNLDFLQSMVKTNSFQDNEKKIETKFWQSMELHV